MTPTEIKRLVKTLRAVGVTHFKTPEVELALGPEPLPKLPPSNESEKTEVPHVVEELVSVMKLSDTDLVDRMFPDTEKDAPDEL